MILAQGCNKNFESHTECNNNGACLNDGHVTRCFCNSGNYTANCKQSLEGIKIY